MLLGTLGASLLGSILVVKGINRTGEQKISKNNNKKQNWFLMPPHPLTNFEIQKYYHNLRRFNGLYSRNNLPKIRHGAYVINLDEYSDVGTRWIALCVLNNDFTYFDTFGVEHTPKEIKAFMVIKTQKTNIFRI